MLKVSVIFGTRPEAIKLAPVVLAMKRDDRFDCRVCVTAQHREMLDQVLEAFGVAPDTDLNLMIANQGLGGLTAAAISALDRYIAEERPRLVLVQGDTTTAFCAALAAFYHDAPIGHVEAGLRTGDMNAPWPEEANRVLISRLATLHFAPTLKAGQNLLDERVDTARIWVTGNTVIDALFLALEKVKAAPPDIPGISSDTLASWKDNPMVLITGHRRESFGTGFESICRSIAELARRFPMVQFVYPVHLNPNVREPVTRILGPHSGSKTPIPSPAGGRGLPPIPSPLMGEGQGEGESLNNVHLIDPLPYLSFVALMDRATIILTDSGGIQEEAPSLAKPVLVMRDKTERPEAVEAGTVKLVGTDFGAIVEQTSRLLTDRSAYDQMARSHNPYGDGKATGRILDACHGYLHH